jgi:hypothetical protein
MRWGELMELVFVSNDGKVLQTDEEKWNHYEMTRKQRKLTFYIYNVKKLKFNNMKDNLTEIDKSKGGVYFLYNKLGELLNIGQTYALYIRIYRKWCGKTGGSIADEHFYRFYTKVKVIYIESEIDRKLCEIFFINKEKPPLNYQYAYYDTWVYKFMTTEFAKSKDKMWSWRKDKVESDKVSNEIFKDLYMRFEGGN